MALALLVGVHHRLLVLLEHSGSGDASTPSEATSRRRVARVSTPPAVRWLVFGISGMMAGIAGVMLRGLSAAGIHHHCGP